MIESFGICGIHSIFGQTHYSPTSNSLPIGGSGTHIISQHAQICVNSSVFGISVDATTKTL